MNITLLANRDLASIVAINYLLQQAEQHSYCVFLSAKVGGNQDKPEALAKLSFFEQDLFNDILFPALSLSSSHNRRFKSFDDLEKMGIAVKEMANINTEQGWQDIASTKPDLIVSIRFGQILKSDVIKLPKYGVLNLHSGRLPDYRGVMATFWAMLDNQQDLATTLHFIQDAQIDAGDIISINSQPTDYSKSYLWNVLSLYRKGVKSIARAIETLQLDGKLEQQQVDITLGNYFSFPNETHLRQFAEQGNQLIDVNEIKEFAWLFMRDDQPLNQAR